MGRFLNPDNSAFQVALNSEIYVDKTALLEYINTKLNTNQALICNSRPRRFGKSITANMLAAYYSRGCDSLKMFEKMNIGKCHSFQKHLNKYDVIHFDVQWFSAQVKSVSEVVSYIEKSIIEELNTEYAGILPDSTDVLSGALSLISNATGKRFIVIIDEWDVLIRDEAANQSVQNEYINFLRGMFKGTEPTKFIYLAYLTGILPVKKLKTQSALNNFKQYSMINPGALASYIGFTEEEVIGLCEKYGRDYEKVKRWYDGYQLGNYHVYNPNAVVNLMLDGEYQSYWSDTGTYESIVPLINMNFDGLKTDIIGMLSGTDVSVDVSSFQNDMVSFTDKNDVITLLIHLGYLAYDQKKQTAFIPNEEIRQEFTAATKRGKWNELFESWQKSADLLEATLDIDSQTVAAGIEKIHMEYASTIQYNNENSLSSVLTIAYLSAMQYYFKPVRELPTGRGFADFVFVPKPEYAEEYPALLVELKWDKNADTAIRQIKEKHYPSAFECYTGDILLVGINYNKKTKEHQCLIEKYEKI